MQKQTLEVAAVVPEHPYTITVKAKPYIATNMTANL
jgi:hypothetical protein